MILPEDIRLSEEGLGAEWPKLLTIHHRAGGFWVGPCMFAYF